MRTLKLALAAAAAFAFSNANAQPVNGMEGPNGAAPQTPAGMYQAPVVGTAPQNIGFHAGGVAACDGCHVMHNANDGVAKSTVAAATSVAPWTNVTNMYLLQGSDQSSTCLICHQGASSAGFEFTVATPSGATPTNYTPGGDFSWVRSEFNWTNSPGERHGHNVAAADFGMGVDTSLDVAPGGTWVGGAGRRAFACSSCHDPHGRYRMQLDAAGSYGVKFVGPLASDALPIAASGSYGEPPAAGYAVGAYRLLAGQAYAPASNPGFPFPNDPPIAVAPQDYNRSENASETRVAYGTGMSEWCQNCHTNIHLDGYTSGVAGLRHPAGSEAVLHAGQYQVYNTYVSSGVINPASTANYTSLVPFEQGAAVTSVAALAATANTNIVAGAQSAVMCLSCHRAHASAFDSMVRWDQNATFLTNANAFTDGVTAGTRNATLTQAGYYDRAPAALGAYQRSLCNKCHGKD